MEYLKKEIRTFQNGKTVNDQFYIDDDYNVPDAKKDVGRIIRYLQQERIRTGACKPGRKDSI